MWRRTFGFSFIVLSGCSGGQSGDPGVVDTREPENVIAPASDCEVERWLPDEPSPSTFRCEVENGGRPHGKQPVAWACDCAGTSRSVESVLCIDALEDACDVDPHAARTCDAPLGRCFPNDAAGSNWLCRCAQDAFVPDEEIDNVASDDCYTAVSMACGEHCASDVGSCLTNPNAMQGFECSCAPLVTSTAASVANSGRLITETDLSCETALAGACGAECERETGHCSLMGNAFACDCNDMTSGAVDVASLWEAVRRPGAALCEDAVYEVCGHINPGPECESSTPDWTAQCTAQPYVSHEGAAPPASHTFDCNCSSRVQDAAAPTTTTVEAANCDQAVQLSCPGAVRTPSDPNGPTLDFGHPCSTGEECTGGSCYEPGTGINSICSKACDTDEDCPTFARCAALFNHQQCFVNCTTDDECLALNPSSMNPLRCATDLGSGPEPGVCIQSSEP